MQAREVDEAVRRLDAQSRSLELGHEQLVNQMAELTIQQANMGKQIEDAMDRALDRFADRFVDRLQAKAAEHTGRWVWRAVKAAASRWLLITFIVLTVGKMAGWQFAAAVFDALTGKGK